MMEASKGSMQTKSKGSRHIKCDTFWAIVEDWGHQNSVTGTMRWDRPNDFLSHCKTEAGPLACFLHLWQLRNGIVDKLME